MQIVFGLCLFAEVLLNRYNFVTCFVTHSRKSRKFAEYQPSEPMKKPTPKKVKEPIRLRQKAIANGCLSLYLDIYTTGRRSYEFLRLYLIPERTPADKLRNAETLRTANAIKAQRILELQNNAHGLSNTRTRGRVLLVDYIQQTAEKYRAQGQTSMYWGFKSLRSQVEAYNKTAQLANIDRAYLYGFIDHLNWAKSCKSKGDTPKPLTPTSKAHFYNRLVTVIRRAIAEGIITHDPTAQVKPGDKPKIAPAPRRYLTLDEVRRIAAQPAEGIRENIRQAHRLVKRAFLFSCFCGLRLCDVRRLRWSDIKADESGRKQAEIIQQKTKEPLILPLSANALEWLPEQPETAAPDDLIFKLPKSSTVAILLRRIAKAAGVDKPVTFHIARHTHATLLLTYGADIYTVSKLLGHTNVRTTQIYAKVIDESKRRAVDNIPQI